MTLTINGVDHSFILPNTLQNSRELGKLLNINMMLNDVRSFEVVLHVIYSVTNLFFEKEVFLFLRLSKIKYRKLLKLFWSK